MRKCALILQHTLPLLFYLLLPTASKAEHVPYRIFGPLDGLPSVEINRIFRDSNGLLWFCTEEGLSYFDGQRFKTYSAEQGLPDRSANDMLETKDGQYWVATMRGLSRFHPNAQLAGGRKLLFESYQPSEGGPALQIAKLALGKDDKIWCSTHDGLYSFQPLTKRFQKVLSVIGGDWWTALLPEPDGSLWLGSQALFHLWPHGKVDRFGEQEGFAPRLLRVTDLLKDQEARLWVGAWKGLYRMIADPKPGQNSVDQLFNERQGLPNHVIFSLFQNTAGRLLVGIQRGGLFELVPNDRKRPEHFQSVAGSDGLIVPDFGQPTVDVINEDRNHNIWLSQGIRINLSGFVSFTQRDGLRTADIGSIFEDKNGHLVVLTCDPRCQYVDSFDGKRFESAKIDLPKSLDQVTWGFNQIHFQDREGDWWIATTKGLCRYKGSRPLSELLRRAPQRIYSQRDGLVGDEVFRLFEDSRGDIWISMLGRNAVSVWHRQSDRIETYTHDANGRPLDVPTAFVEDRSGNIWYSFYSGYMARFRAGQFRVFASAEGLPASAVRTLFVDHAGRLWLGTGRAGLFCMENPAADQPILRPARVASPFSSSEIKSIVEDRNGLLYVCTGRGIDRFDPATGTLRHYTWEDGLGASATPRVSYRDRHGALWFGGMGLLRFTPPSKQIAMPGPAHPRITLLRIRGKEYPVSELGETSVTLPRLSAIENDIHIEFAAYNFEAGKKLAYQYRLAGSSPTLWTTTSATSVDLAALRPGDYRFEVRNLASDTQTITAPEDEAATVFFSIAPPLWQRWWFLASLAFVLSAIAFALHRARLNQIMAIERIRSHIGSDLHDDAGSTLSQISFLSAVARNEISTHPGQAELLLAQIGELSRELANSMAEIVWALNSQHDRIEDLTSHLRRFANELFEPRAIEFEFVNDSESHQTTKLRVDTKRQTFLVFKELLTNVIKHSFCRRVRTSISVDNDFLSLCIEDDGVGFDTERKGAGNGIGNMQRRAQSLGGSLTICSTPGAGTKALLRLPIKGRPWIRYLNR